jgi:hypothetical protein
MVTTQSLSNQAWLVTGNRGLNPTNGYFLGTLDTQPLELRTYQTRAFRLEPDTNDFGAPNVIGGSPANFVDPGIYGATIAGGGVLNYTTNGFEPGPGSNRVSAIWGTIGGGRRNFVAADHSFIGGGHDNVIREISYDSVIGGGAGNTISPFSGSSVIGGGTGNNANGFTATVSGGDGNTANGFSATVGGGGGNTASGDSATIPGGNGNVASGAYSFAAGNQAQAVHSGAFVWADNSGAMFPSTAANQFAVRAGGGVRLNGDVSLEGGYRRLELSGGNSLGFLYGSYPYFGDGVHVGYNFYADAAGNPHVINPGGGSSRITAGYGQVVLGVGNPGFGPNTQRLVANISGVTVYGTFNNSSDRNAKQDFASVNASEILEKVTQLPITKWSYKEDASTRHIGPVAQDFHAAFNIGTDDKHIAPIDEGGVALAAIQGLNQALTEKDARITALEKSVAELKELVARLAEKR